MNQQGMQKNTLPIVTKVSYNFSWSIIIQASALTFVLKSSPIVRYDLFVRTTAPEYVGM